LVGAATAHGANVGEGVGVLVTMGVPMSISILKALGYVMSKHTACAHVFGAYSGWRGAVFACVGEHGGWAGMPEGVRIWCERIDRASVVQVLADRRQAAILARRRHGRTCADSTRWTGQDGEPAGRGKSPQGQALQ
jgi:hypothetical protein